MRKCFGLSVVAAFALGGCERPADEIKEARAAFDQVLRHPESRAAGVAVPAGSEDRVFECFTKTVKAEGVSLPVASASMKTFFDGKDFDALPPKEKQEATIALMTAMGSIMRCQGGPPPETR